MCETVKHCLMFVVKFHLTVIISVQVSIGDLFHFALVIPTD